MIRIILVDDHTLVRNAIRQLLKNEPDIQIVGETGTGVEAIQLVREIQPDSVLLDLKLPDISGLEVTARLMRLNPAPKILILTSTPNGELASRLIAAGALGYLTKEVSHEELIHAIKTIHEGQCALGSTTANRLALAKIDRASSAIFSALTDKEMEILMLSVRDVSIPDTAKRLHMSARTIHSYRSRIFNKLQVENNVKMTLLAIREGLITIEEAGH